MSLAAVLFAADSTKELNSMQRNFWEARDAMQDGRHESPDPETRTSQKLSKKVASIYFVV